MMLNAVLRQGHDLRQIELQGLMEDQAQEEEIEMQVINE